MGHPVPKIDAAVIRRTLHDLDLSVNQLAPEAHMSPSSIHTWLREGQAPACMELVCEAVRQRHARRRGLAAEAAPDVTLVVKVSRQEQDVVQRFLDAVRARAYEIA